MPDEPPISLTGKVDDLEGPIVKLIQITSIDANLKQEIFITTVDKARNCLKEALANVEQRNAWAAPAGILATIVVGFPTATFQDFIHFERYLESDVHHSCNAFRGMASPLFVG